MSIKSGSFICFLCVLLASLWSGCTIFNSVDFQVLSQNVGDDAGFPSLYVVFNTSDTVTVQLRNDAGTLFEQRFFKGTHNAVMHLGDYWETPRGGVYTLKAMDSNGNIVFENPMTFTGAVINISGVDMLWWQEEDHVSLVGVQLNVINTGDLPAYPYQMRVMLEGMVVYHRCLPRVIPAYQGSIVEAVVYLPEIDPSDVQVDVGVLSLSDFELDVAEVHEEPTDNVEEVVFSWRYKGAKVLRVPEILFLYQYHRDSDRFLTDDYTAYLFDPFDDGFISLVTAQLADITGSYTLVEKVNAIAAFAQDITYATDDDLDPTCEYPRFPIETLIDNKGDCEDKALLTAAILEVLGYEVALLRLPNHMAVGVALGEDATSFDYFYDGYYFLETTRNRWIVGKVPDEYVGISNVSAYPISSRPILLHTWTEATRITSSDGTDYVRVNCIVENIGSGAAPNFEVQGAFYTNVNQSFNVKKTVVFSLLPGLRKVVQLEIDVPQGITTILRTQVLMNGEVVHEKESTSTFP